MDLREEKKVGLMKEYKRDNEEIMEQIRKWDLKKYTATENNNE